MKIFIRTLMSVFTILFFVITFYFYTVDTKTRANSSVPKLPDFEHDTNQAFLDDVVKCVAYIYHKDKKIIAVNLELLLAQASLESAWGTSRFAKEGKNLFGIRTYDLTEPHMLPSNKPKKWGVKVYMHECDSVRHYIDILNNGSNFENYRKLREDGIDDPFILVETLDAYATDVNYFPKIKSIITKIRNEYTVKYVFNDTNISISD